MNLVYYTPDCTGAGRLLWQLNKNLDPKVSSSICRDINELQEQLRKPPTGPRIAVLLAACVEDLKKLISIKSLLHGMRIILILPDREKETISMGHILGPRFLSYVDCEFKDVAAVLMRMVQKRKSEF